jgi:hypothetical protein
MLVAPILFGFGSRFNSRDAEVIDVLWGPRAQKPAANGRDDDLPSKIVQDFRNGIDDDSTPVEMLVFKNEGHTLLSSSSRLVAAQQQIDWFRKYLMS